MIVLKLLLCFNQLVLTYKKFSRVGPPQLLQIANVGALAVQVALKTRGALPEAPPFEARLGSA